MGEVEAAVAAIADADGPAAERLRAAFLCMGKMNQERYLSEAVTLAEPFDYLTAVVDHSAAGGR